jgi:hypothetical protein
VIKVGRTEITVFFKDTENRDLPQPGAKCWGGIGSINNRETKERLRRGDLKLSSEA